ncbi:Oidioi.mRNA.OKI2018_I69.chr2.g5897.t1.cds [Oikopleura dioica]|uniref:Oidioi.mRNA.OKI2018_I69.chr2.g5897.t1.cds n=1 Tax=Oikopleura dioica TaxID=34765 RepID=A0ABN7TAT6_OIKDI|nr:Oidioi.mRNA.OKI2018_I69.chr2.g5897.t1.cds [Oikopleura dioica]
MAYYGKRLDHTYFKRALAIIDRNWIDFLMEQEIMTSDERVMKLLRFTRLNRSEKEELLESINTAETTEEKWNKVEERLNNGDVIDVNSLKVIKLKVLLPEIDEASGYLILRMSDLKTLLDEIASATAETCYDFFAAKIKSAVSRETHIHQYNVMMMLMQKMITFLNGSICFSGHDDSMQKFTICELDKEVLHTYKNSNNLQRTFELTNPRRLIWVMETAPLGGYVYFKVSEISADRVSVVLGVRVIGKNRFQLSTNCKQEIMKITWDDNEVDESPMNIENGADKRCFTNLQQLTTFAKNSEACSLVAVRIEEDIPLQITVDFDSYQVIAQFKLRPEPMNTGFRVVDPNNMEDDHLMLIQHFEDETAFRMHSPYAKENRDSSGDNDSQSASENSDVPMDENNTENATTASCEEPKDSSKEDPQEKVETNEQSDEQRIETAKGQHHDEPQSEKADVVDEQENKAECQHTPMKIDHKSDVPSCEKKASNEDNVSVVSMADTNDSDPDTFDSPLNSDFEFESPNRSPSTSAD